MMGSDTLQSATPAQLLALYADVLAELRQRGIARSTNNPAGDYAEYLIAKALGLQLSSNSNVGYDATGADGTRYQVKGRRLTASKHPSRQLGALRNLPERHFDYLAGVLFAEDFSVARACLIPADVVAQEATYRAHVNAWILQLRDGLWAVSGVRDITDAVRAAAADEAWRGGDGPAPHDAPEVAVVEAERVVPEAPVTGDAGGSRPTSEPKVTYHFSRFCFKADLIEPLDMPDAFRVITKRDGVFQMTKADFYRDFPRVRETRSYRVDRLYHYPKVPKQALPYRVAE